MDKADERSKYKAQLDDPDIREMFLGLVSEVGNVSKAAQLCGIDRTTVYSHARRDAQFKEEFKAAQKLGVEGLEDVARTRAVDGVPRPIIHKGEVVATVHEYSDSLLKMLLKGGKPEKYAERRVITPPNSGSVLAIMDLGSLKSAIEEARQLKQVKQIEHAEGEVIDVSL